MADAIRRPCNHSGGQGIGAGHVCLCVREAGHPLDSDRPHGCSCMALWADSVAVVKEPDRWLWHVGRSFSDTRLEDSCPCPKAPCGLVISDRIDGSCTEHPWQRGKAMRQGHLPADCPGVKG
jgi:hypothetical protein